MADDEGEAAGSWIVDMEEMLGCLDNREIKACSISRVSKKIRQVKEEAYSPKFVSIGPFHRKDGIDLQKMEETKWRYMHALIIHRKKGGLHMFRACCEAIQKMDSVVRASYGGDIELKPEELARIMVLDGCFVLELLLKLYDNVAKKINPELGNIEEKILPVLIDLSLLENQIPSVVLTTLVPVLSRKELMSQKRQDKGETPYEFPTHKTLAHAFPTHKELVNALFKYGDSSKDAKQPWYCACHFLHCIHLASPDPHGNHVKSMKATKQLERCATKLEAFGISIKDSDPNDSTSNIRVKTEIPKTNASTDDNTTEKVASALEKFVDRFDFKIVFKEDTRELIIPPLHIKERTEKRWRNLIAWEQSGVTGIGYKFTSYAFFFNGLICSVHDIELLKDKNTIVVEDKEMSNQKLLTMFQNITTNVEQMDVTYSGMCEILNKVECARGCRIILWWHYLPPFLAWLQPKLLTMFQNITANVLNKVVVVECARGCRIKLWWHYLRRFLAWLRRKYKSSADSFKQIYLDTPWHFMGAVAATVLLVLTLMQTIYALMAYYRGGGH